MTTFTMTTAPTALYKSLRLAAPQPRVFYDGQMRTEWAYPANGVVLIKHQSSFQECLDRLPAFARGGTVERAVKTAKKTKTTKKTKTAKKTKTVKKEKKERIYIFNSKGTAGTYLSTYNKEDGAESGLRWWTKGERPDGNWEIIRREVPGILCPKKPRTFIHKTWSDAYHHRAIYNRLDNSKPWKWICLGNKDGPGPSGKWETVKVD
jgi:hypothetical protein